MAQQNLPLNQVIQGNCIQALADLPEESVDMVFADPPYNLQLQQTLWRPNLTRVDAVDDAWDQFKSLSDYDQFTREWLSACRRVLKDNGTIWVIGTYHNIFRVGAILQDLDYWILNSVVWVKANPMPNFRGVRFTNSHEILLWAQKKRGLAYTFNHHAMRAVNADLQMRSDWYLPLCTGKERLKINGTKAHATQKPESLLYRVILSSTQPEDIVLDPFFGTGTTGAVAQKLHRRWIGIELDPAYVEMARERINSQPANGVPEAVFNLAEKRSEPRLSVGVLLENGLLQPGQTLYFGERGDLTATVLSNGHIRHKDMVGSIHQVGKALQNAPCNGWEHWYYVDDSTGERVVIDHLRQKAKEANGL